MPKLEREAPCFAWRTNDGSLPFTSSLAVIAREAMRARLSGEDYEPHLSGGEASFGVFVALRAPDGRIRSARGSMGEPRGGSLVEEIVEHAVAACSEGRTPLAGLAELARLTVEISLLRAVEEVETVAEIDPAQHGVLVEQGPRRGMFLPFLPDADSAEEQLRIACEAGEIDRERPFEIYRIIVDRLVEPQAVS